MNDDVSILVCAAGAAWELPLLRGLQRDDLGIRVARRCVDHGELLGIALRDRPRAVVVDGALPWVDRDLASTLRRSGVELVVIGAGTVVSAAIGGHAVPETIAAVELAGLVHGLATSSPEALIAADEASPADESTGRLVVAWGGPGAPGRTTVAVHFAVEAARAGRRTLLIDGDSWAASVAQLLDVTESPSVAQATRLAGSGWPRPLGDCLQAGPHGVSVLAGLPRAELWPEIGADAWQAVLEAATREFELVIVDVAAPIEEDEELVVDRIPFRRNLMTTVALDRADQILFVSAGDPVGLRRAVVAHRTLVDRWGERAPRLAIAVNRAPRAARQLQDCSRAIERWLGSAPAAVLPEEPTFRRVVWEGRMLHDLAPRSPWIRELRGLVDEVAA